MKTKFDENRELEVFCNGASAEKKGVFICYLVKPNKNNLSFDAYQHSALSLEQKFLELGWLKR